MPHACLSDHRSGAGHHSDPVLPGHGASGLLIHQRQRACVGLRQLNAGTFALVEVDRN